MRMARNAQATSPTTKGTTPMAIDGSHEATTGEGSPMNIDSGPPPGEVGGAVLRSNQEQAHLPKINGGSARGATWGGGGG